MSIMHLIGGNIVCTRLKSHTIEGKYQYKAIGIRDVCYTLSEE